MTDDILTPDRRRLLALAALGALAPGTTRAATPEEDESLRQFAADCAKLDPRAAKDVPSRDAYVFSTAAAGVQIRNLPSPQFKPLGAYAPGVDTGVVGRFGPCVVLRYRVAPGASLPPHNHPNYSVATVGLSGEARFEQFEPAGELPPYASTAPFRIRKVAEKALIGGGLLTLAPDRDNMHAFTAGPQGAAFFDIISLHTKDEGFSNMTLARKLKVGEVGEARWLKI